MKTVVTYVAEDGKVFEDESKCLKYERSLDGMRLGRYKSDLAFISYYKRKRLPFFEGQVRTAKTMFKSVVREPNETRRDFLTRKASAYLDWQSALKRLAVARKEYRNVRTDIQKLGYDFGYKTPINKVKQIGGFE